MAKADVVNYPNNPTGAVRIAISRRPWVCQRTTYLCTTPLFGDAFTLQPLTRLRSRRQRDRARIPLAVEDLQHDRVAHRVGLGGLTLVVIGQSDQHRLRNLPGRAVARSSTEWEQETRRR